MLTSRQKQCYDFIKSRILETGRSPTYADIACELGCVISNVHYLVSQLISRGFVKRLPHQWHGLSLAVQYFKLTPVGLVQI